MILLKQRGAAYSSFVILIAIIGLTLLAQSMNRDITDYRVNNSRLLKEQFDTLGTALTTYYISTCNSGPITQSSLIPYYLSHNIKFDEGTAYIMSIDSSGPIPTYTISLDITSNENIELFTFNLKAYDINVTGNTISLTKPILKLKLTSRVQGTYCP